MTIEEVVNRKLEVQGRLRREQLQMKYCMDELKGDYQKETTRGPFRWARLKKVGSVVGGVKFGIGVVRSLIKHKKELGLKG